MTDPFDDAELIEVETVLTSDRLNIDRDASTPETRDRYAVFKSKPLGSTWQEGDRLYRKGPGGITVFNLSRWT